MHLNKSCEINSNNKNDFWKMIYIVQELNLIVFFTVNMSSWDRYINPRTESLKRCHNRRLYVTAETGETQQPKQAPTEKHQLTLRMRLCVCVLSTLHATSDPNKPVFYLQPESNLIHSRLNPTPFPLFFRSVCK